MAEKETSRPVERKTDKKREGGKQMEWRRVESPPQRRTKWRIQLHAAGHYNCKGALTEKAIHCSSAQKYYPPPEESLWVKEKKSIDIKGEPWCELQEPLLVIAAPFDIMPEEPGRLGKISGLITTACTCAEEHNEMSAALNKEIYMQPHMKIKLLSVTRCLRVKRAMFVFLRFVWMQF